MSNGGSIQTEGIKYESGAHVHIHDPAGKMVFRAFSREFKEKSEETTLALIQALKSQIPDLCEENPDEAAFDFNGCFLIISSQHMSLIRNLEDYIQEQESSDQNEIIYYDEKEWIQEPELVLGALINCLRQNSKAPQT